MQHGQEGVTNLCGQGEEKDEHVLKGSSACCNKMGKNQTGISG